MNHHELLLLKFLLLVSSTFHSTLLSPKSKYSLSFPTLLWMLQISHSSSFRVMLHQFSLLCPIVDYFFPWIFLLSYKSVHDDTSSEQNWTNHNTFTFHFHFQMLLPSTFPLYHLIVFFLKFYFNQFPPFLFSNVYMINSKMKSILSTSFLYMSMPLSRHYNLGVCPQHFNEPIL